MLGIGGHSGGEVPVLEDPAGTLPYTTDLVAMETDGSRQTQAISQGKCSSDPWIPAHGLPSAAPELGRRGPRAAQVQSLRSRLREGRNEAGLAASVLCDSGQVACPLWAVSLLVKEGFMGRCSKPVLLTPSCGCDPRGSGRCWGSRTGRGRAPISKNLLRLGGCVRRTRLGAGHPPRLSEATAPRPRPPGGCWENRWAAACRSPWHAGRSRVNAVFGNVTNHGKA